jgi:hypothetical protein
MIVANRMKKITKQWYKENYYLNNYDNFLVYESFDGIQQNDYNHGLQLSKQE